MYTSKESYLSKHLWECMKKDWKMADDNVVELKPGIRITGDTDESKVLNATGAMVALALLAQRYEQDANNHHMPIEDCRLIVHIISPLCTLLQKNTQLAIDLCWQINEIIADNCEEVEYDEDYE